MILKRKIYKKLLSWKNESKGTKAILIEGARRIGKSTICEEFGKNEYTSYILIDFAKKNEIVEGYSKQYRTTSRGCLNEKKDCSRAD